MKYLEAIPERASGELTIKGSRIRIALVIKKLANGETIDLKVTGAFRKITRHPHIA
jgi:uncharacterized protein (DUF433 family)